MSPQAVLIEANAFLQHAVSSRLRLQGFETQVFERPSQAWPVLQGLEQGLVVTNLEDGGLELFGRLRQHGQNLPCLLLSEEIDELLQARLWPQGALLCPPHPARLSEVFKRLQAHQLQLRVQLESVTLYDLVQLLAHSQANTHLYLTDVQTNAEGLLWFQQGQLRHAVFDTLIGEEAFFEIMGLTQGLFMETDLGRLEYYSIETEIPRLVARSALRQDESLLAPVALAVLDKEEGMVGQLQAHFPASRLQVCCVHPADSDTLATLDASLLIVNLEALSGPLPDALASVQSHFRGPILLVGEQIYPGVAEVLQLGRVEQFFLRQLQWQELLTLVQHRCFSQRFSGLLQRLSLFDCLQIMGQSPVPVCLQCQDGLSGESGEIYLGNGQIWHAQLGELTGLKALAACLEIKVGLITSQESRKPAEFSINASLTRVLMNLAVEKDRQVA